MLASLRRHLPLLPALAALALPTIAAVPLAAGKAQRATGTPQPLLPDIVEEPPYKPFIHDMGPNAASRWALTFYSSADNVGRGPLIVTGARTAATDPFRATQVVDMTDGTQRTYPHAGTFRFSTSHDHWHLLRFQRYELRRVGSGKVLRRDHKAGFCLGDRAHTPVTLPPGVKRAPQGFGVLGECGQGQPEALSLQEGLSVGWKDDYKPLIHGQFLPVSGLPRGNYVLAFRANEDGRLKELRRDNNASSAELRLAWPRGTGHRPTLELLHSCFGTATCPAR